MKELILKIIELLKQLLGMVDKDHVEAPSSEIPWFDQGLTVIGMNEIKDGKVNPIVTEMFSYTSYKTKKNEPWCAAGICWCLAKTGFANPATARAKDFAKYGVATDYKRGAIVVMRHKSGQHHVTMFDSWVDKANKIAKCYGFNQGNSAKFSNYDFKKEETVLGVRWPVVAKESTR